MKSLVKSLVIVATIGFCATSVSARNSCVLPSVMLQDTIVKDTVKKEVPQQPLYLAQNEVSYEKIETDKLPESVKTAVAAKYENYTVEEAYLASDKTYKLVLKKGENKLTVYYNAAGEFVKEENAPAENAVVLI